MSNTGSTTLMTDNVPQPIKVSPDKVRTVKPKKKPSKPKKKPSKPRKSAEEKATKPAYTPGKTIYTDQVIIEIADDLLQWINTDGNIWLKRYLTQRGYNRMTVQRMIARSEYFADVYERVKDIQETKICEGICNQTIPQSFGIFSLKALHHWTEMPGHKKDIAVVGFEFVEVTETDTEDEDTSQD